MKRETLDRIVRFNQERDWDQFHSPANLAKSIAIESSELLECFQWNEENYDLNRYVPIYMESETLTKKLLVSNAVMQKYITLQTDLIKEKDKKIDFLEKEVRRLEDGLIAITG